ncbi:hypothetical protein MOC16_gp369 [Klebsiella phage vB_KpM_FBKp24]|uniref:Uncharacterized protein n=1 Tax=Klebsiella phage vB_KpM_FBKp24 TaxID=2801834 RepID=A0A7U0J5J8_9CAUD|nr:hypothetical protein MOC16_gp369 [Klebsiella phage vB_KpM_FBKp24]QQV92323.1 hypothetical protein vBKpMFBKp24_044 [Klebsiella phage vB_KpM_FBKp24]
MKGLLEQIFLQKGIDNKKTGFEKKRVSYGSLTTSKPGWKMCRCLPDEGRTVKQMFLSFQPARYRDNPNMNNRFLTLFRNDESLLP